jgi:hypothetical protein
MRWPPLILLLTFFGCATPGPQEAICTVEPGRYVQAFDAAKDVLASYRFELDRVDARAGVITTLPKPTSGLATPWDDEQSSLLDEWEDLVNQQFRRVRVTFEPAEPAPPDAPEPEVRLVAGPLVARVEVMIDRRRRPGWRVETSSIRFSSFTQDPSLVERQMAGKYDTPFARDERLAARIGHQIRLALDASAPRP